LTDIHEIDSLKERIARIEQTVQEIKQSIGGEQGEMGGNGGDSDDWWGGGEEAAGADELTPEEVDLIKRGNEIDAVKSYHERTGLGLKESKDAVVRLGAGLGG
jgi:ribosomal protein L7/L12